MILHSPFIIAKLIQYCIVLLSPPITSINSRLLSQTSGSERSSGGTVGGGGRKEGRKETSVELRWRLIVVTQSLTPVFPASRRGRTASSARFRERVNRVIAVHVRD